MEYKYDDVTIESQIQGILDNILNCYKVDSQKPKCQEDKSDLDFNNGDKFKDNIKPGRMVRLLAKDDVYFGIILDCKTIVYVDNLGHIKGYINNYTSTIPYKITHIFVPTNDVYALSDWAKMKCVWKYMEKPTRVKKTVQDIENELGLAPGTLQII